MITSLKIFTFAAIVIIAGSVSSPPASAFDVFDIHAPAIGENLSGGRPGNTNNWPADILQAIKTDQILAVEKMEQSGFSCWNVVRTVEGKTIDVNVKKGFFERLWGALLSSLKRLFGIAARKIDFSGSDIIFGPPCSCPPPPFEKDPLTGKPSVVKIFSIFVDDVQYKKSIEAEVKTAFTWDFVGRGWNCTLGNPEGFRDPELSSIPQTPIPPSLRSVTYPERFIARDQKGKIPVGGNFLGGRKFQFEAEGSPAQIAEKAAEEIKTYLSEEEDGLDLIAKFVHRGISLDDLIKLGKKAAETFEEIEEALREKLAAFCSEKGGFVSEEQCLQSPECEKCEKSWMKASEGFAAGILRIPPILLPCWKCIEKKEPEEPVEYGPPLPPVLKVETAPPPAPKPAPLKEPAPKPLPAPKPKPLPAPKPVPAPKPGCDLSAFEPCADKCEPPQECVKRCPFIPVTCPPGTAPDVVSCAELDQTCSYGCLNTANACLNACLKMSNCAMEDIPASLRPASKQKPPQ